MAPLMEGIVDGLMQILTAQMPAKCAAIALEKQDYPLPAPARYLDYEPGQNEAPERPLVCVLPGATSFLTDTGFAGGGFADAAHMAAILILVEDADPRALSRKMLRYQRAVMEVVGANRTGVMLASGQQAWAGLSIEGTIPGDRFVPHANPDGYSDFMLVLVKATKTES